MYTRWGDWFPILYEALAAGALAAGGSRAAGPLRDCARESRRPLEAWRSQDIRNFVQTKGSTSWFRRVF